MIEINKMIERTQVEKGVEALLALMKMKDKSVNIVDQPDKIDLQLTLKNIPKLKHKTIPLSLPHSIHFSTREVCVFVKDLDKKNREYDATVQHYEDIFTKEKVTCISKIIPIKALRTDYSMPSTKRSLAKAYDLYLADSCVFGVLPGLLGKIFFAKKKTCPLQINLGSKDVKTEIETVVHNSRCILQGTGSSSMAYIAHSDMSKEEIVDNTLAVANQIAEKVPGGLANIRNLYIKSSDTTAVPLYVSFGAPNDIDMPEVKVKVVATYIDDVTTVEQGKVLVRPNGFVRVLSKKEEAKELKRMRDREEGIKEVVAKKPKLEVKEEMDENISTGKTKIKTNKKKTKGKKTTKTTARKTLVKSQDIEIKDEIAVKGGKPSKTKAVKKMRKVKKPA